MWKYKKSNNSGPFPLFCVTVRKVQILVITKPSRQQGQSLNNTCLQNIHCYEMRCEEASFFKNNNRMLWSSRMFGRPMLIVEIHQTVPRSASLFSLSWQPNGFLYDINLASFGTDACKIARKSKKKKTFKLSSISENSNESINLIETSSYKI